MESKEEALTQEPEDVKGHRPNDLVNGPPRDDSCWSSRIVEVDGVQVEQPIIGC